MRAAHATQLWTWPHVGRLAAATVLALALLLMPTTVRAEDDPKEPASDGSPKELEWKSALGHVVGPRVLARKAGTASDDDAALKIWRALGEPPLPPFASVESYQAWLHDLERMRAEAEAPEAVKTAWTQDAKRTAVSIHFLHGLSADLAGGEHHVLGVGAGGRILRPPLRIQRSLKLSPSGHGMACGTKALPKSTGIGLVATAGTRLGSYGDKRWPNGKTIQVELGRRRRSKKSSADQEWIGRYLPYWANIWTNYANVRFRFEGSHKWKKGSDLRVSASKKHKKSLFNSSVGTDASAKRKRRKATMKLRGITEDARPHGVVLHEFGHALGFRHEHASPLALEDLMTSEAIEEKRRDQGWSKQDAKDYMEKDLETPNSFSSYDVHSIMHYAFPLHTMSGSFSDLPDGLKGALREQLSAKLGDDAYTLSDKKLDKKVKKKDLDLEFGGSEELSLLDMYWAGVFYPKWVPKRAGRETRFTRPIAPVPRTVAPWLRGLPPAYHDGHRDAPFVGDFFGDGRADIGSVVMHVNRAPVPGFWHRDSDRGGWLSIRRYQGLYGQDSRARGIDGQVLAGLAVDKYEPRYGVMSERAVNGISSRYSNYYSRHFCTDRFLNPWDNRLGRAGGLGTAGQQVLTGDIDGNGKDEILFVDRRKGEWSILEDTRKPKTWVPSTKHFCFPMERWIASGRNEWRETGRYGRFARDSNLKLFHRPDARLKKGRVWPVCADFSGDGRDDFGVITFDKKGGSLSVKSSTYESKVSVSANSKDVVATKQFGIPIVTKLPGWFRTHTRWRKLRGPETTIKEIPFAGEFDGQPGAELGRLLVSNTIDCSDGSKSVGVVIQIMRNPQKGRFDTSAPLFLEQVIETGGASGMLPFCGDFDGDGIDELFLVHPRRWQLGKKLGPVWDFPGARWLVLKVTDSVTTFDRAGNVVPDPPAHDGARDPSEEFGTCATSSSASSPWVKALSIIADFDDLLGGRLGADGETAPLKYR